MKVLVLGGTGAIGAHLVRLLSNNDIETVVTSRKQRKSNGKVRYVLGNAHDMTFLRSILSEPWDAIVDFLSYTTPSFEKRVNHFLAATSQYLYLSSARVYAESEGSIIETSPRLLDVSTDEEFLLTDEYPLAKARQEDILHNSGNKNWTIIRPYITYSKNRLQLGVLEKEEWLYRAMQGRTIVLSDDINSQRTTMTFGLDVSEGILSLIGNSSARGESFNITSEYANTWDNILAIYLEVLEMHFGYKPKVSLQNLDKFFEWYPRKYAIMYDRLYNRLFDNSKIAKHINTKSFIKIDEGLKSCLEEFLNDPHFNNINWKREAQRDRQTKEHTPLNEIPGIKQKIKYILFRYYSIHK